MIINELLINKHGKIKQTQICNIKCDICYKTYILSYYYVATGRIKYTKDLCRSCKVKQLYKEGKRVGWSGNSKQRGKTFEERLGKERAIKAKEKMSKARSGENNANFGGKYVTWSAYNKTLVGKTYEERYGKEKADKIKNKLSINSIGENNNMYGKPAPKKAGNGWKGYFNKTYFRSFLELKYIIYLTINNINFMSAEIKKYRINYIDPITHNNRSYSPDFYLINEDLIIELKPKNLLETLHNRAKFIAAKNIFGNRFKVITEEDIPKYSYLDIAEYVDNGSVIFDGIYYNKFINKLSKLIKDI